MNSDRTNRPQRFSLSLSLSLFIWTQRCVSNTFLIRLVFYLHHVVIVVPAECAGLSRVCYLIPELSIKGAPGCFVFLFFFSYVCLQRDDDSADPPAPSQGSIIPPQIWHDDCSFLRLVTPLTSICVDMHVLFTSSSIQLHHTQKAPSVFVLDEFIIGLLWKRDIQSRFIVLT